MKRLLMLSIVLLILFSTAFQTANAQPNQAGGNYSSVNQTGPGNSIYLPLVSLQQNEWPTLAGDVERTSRTAEEVTGQLRPEWYRPIEAYIPQNAHLIASGGMIFVPTSRGLYALNASNGDVVWRFDTQLPIGNSPTVSNGVVYVPGFDRKIHALRASDGAYLWGFSGAGAGFSTNPLVIGGRVFAGNRDGWMYAIGAHGTAQQGQLLWKFQTGGMIDLSAAYKDGILYFASNDNFAYALRAENGTLLWKSAKLPGDGYQSYWPVIYRDMVIFAAASGYRTGMNPGTASITTITNETYGKIFDLERDDIFAGSQRIEFFGSSVSGQTWANGKPVLHAGRIINYLEAKPWRQVLVALRLSDGTPYTWDADGDGRPDGIPGVMWGTHSGNRYPPVVGYDGLLYFSTILDNQSIPQGRVMGWMPGLPYLSQVGGQGAIDEPQALAVGGSMIYRTVCCDRVGDWFSTTSNRAGTAWTYSFPLSTLAPNYDRLWYGSVPGDSVRLFGNYGTLNGIYNAHGDQNPLIPYQGKLYTHRSNAVIAFGPGSARGELPLLTINNVQDSPVPLDAPELRARLESEVQKIIAAGHLRPGYYNAGQFIGYLGNYANYFDNPGDTLYTLSIAYPYLTPGTQASLRGYLRNFFNTYFNSQRPVIRIGWANGAAREAMPLPPEVQASLAPIGDIVDSNSTMLYPHFNFYALWKYAQAVPEDAQAAYNLARSRIRVPVPVDDSILRDRPFEHNAYIAGYIGFLRLYDIVGQPGGNDRTLRDNVDAELRRLQNLRVTQFNKDSPIIYDPVTRRWVGGNYHHRVLNISRNFLFMTPELGDYLAANARGQMETAINEYNFTAPFWFATRYTAAVNEGARQNLYDVPAMYQAKAYILKENRGQLTKYLDASAFERGDLFYIQNLVASLQAP